MYKVHSHVSAAIEWIRTYTLDERGVCVGSQQRIPYLEVTGYLIPTLLDHREVGLAYQYAQFLSYMQKPNGAFVGPDGNEYVFDSGQALRGLLRASEQWEYFKPFARKCADYITAHIKDNGQIPAHYQGEIPEQVHVFVLPALRQAAHVLNDPRYEQAALKALHYYKNMPDVLDSNVLTHFYAYIIDGFIDMGEHDFVRKAVDNVFARQKRNGSISAYPKASWVCSVGLAQFGIIAHKMGMAHQAKEALGCLIEFQHSSGGFFGSYGLGAKYFPKQEISWANKFFLDLAFLLEGKTLGEHKAIAPLDSQQWHKAMVEETIDQMTKRLKENNFPLWCKPLLEKTSVGDVVLELGSGTGELTAILAMYGRNVRLLDYAHASIEFSKALFENLGMHGDFVCHDIRNNIPCPDQSCDWVYSSGVLEHFDDDEILRILKDSRRVCRKGVICLVPNANALLYRIGKFKMEREGSWAYGREVPKVSMRALFETAGFNNVSEYSIGTYHTQRFLKSDEVHIKQFFNSLSPQELGLLNQGYLLCTIGTK